MLILKILINFMTPQEALRILIQNSGLIEEQKEKMLGMIDELSDEDVLVLGKALAKQKQSDLSAAREAVEKLDELIAVEPPKQEE